MRFSASLPSDTTIGMRSSVSESSIDRRASESGMAKTVAYPMCLNESRRRIRREPPATSGCWMRSSAVAPPPALMSETSVSRCWEPKSISVGLM